MKMVKEFFNQMPLPQKIQLALVSVASLAVLVCILIVSALGIDNYQDRMLQERKIIVELLIKKLSPVLAFNDQVGAKAAMESLSVSSGITNACLYRASGELYADFYRNRKELKCPQHYSTSSHSLPSNDHFYFSKQVIENGTLLGYVVIRSEQVGVNSFIRQQIIIGFIVFCGLLLVVLFLARSINRSISKPIVNVMDFTKAVPAHLFKDEIDTKDQLERAAKYLELLTHTVIRDREARNYYLETVKEHSYENSDNAKKATDVLSEIISSGLLNTPKELLPIAHDINRELVKNKFVLDTVCRLSAVYENAVNHSDKEYINLTAMLDKMLNNLRPEVGHRVKLSNFDVAQNVKVYRKSYQEVHDILFRILAHGFSATEQEYSIAINALELQCIAFEVKIQGKKPPERDASSRLYHTENDLRQLILHGPQGKVKTRIEDPFFFFNDDFSLEDFRFAVGCIRYLANASSIEVKEDNSPGLICLTFCFWDENIYTLRMHQAQQIKLQ